MSIIRQHESSDGTVRWYMDEDEECCYIEAAPIHAHHALRLFLDAAAVCGYLPLDEDECEPELTPEGWTRIYLSLAVGIPAQASASIEESAIPIQGGRVKRFIPHMTALAAGLTGAAYVLTGLFDTIGDLTTGGIVG